MRRVRCDHADGGNTVGALAYRPEHGRHRLPDHATPGWHHGGDRADALPERPPPRPPPSHRELVTRQRDEQAALRGVRDEDLAGRVHDPGSRTARDVTRAMLDRLDEDNGQH